MNTKRIEFQSTFFSFGNLLNLSHHGHTKTTKKIIVKNGSQINIDYKNLSSDLKNIGNDMRKAIDEVFDGYQ